MNYKERHYEFLRSMRKDNLIMAWVFLVIGMLYEALMVPFLLRGLVIKAVFYILLGLGYFGLSIMNFKWAATNSKKMHTIDL